MRDELLLLTLQRNQPRILGRLRGLPRRHHHVVSAFSFFTCDFGVREQSGCLGVGVGRVAICSGKPCELDGISRFRQIERSTRLERLDLEIGALVHQIRTALQELVLRLHGLDLASGVVADHVFHDHDVAGLGHGEVGLGRHDQCERLQLGRHLDARVVIVDLHFAEIRCASFRRDRPEHVGEVFVAELPGGFHLVEARVDLDVALFAGDLRETSRLRQERSADQIDSRLTAARPIVDRGCCAANHGHAKQRSWSVGVR